jgi:hypothetical protein
VFEHLTGINDQMDAVTLLTQRRAATRSVVVLAMLFSWFAVSNHCALAALASPAATAQEQCPMHSHPAKQKKEGAPQQCCKTLRAVAPTVAKVLTRTNVVVGTAVFLPAFETSLPAGTSCDASGLRVDTGPPRAATFAESVLQRSILAHAPPAA